MITLSPIIVKLRRAPFSGNIIEFCTFRDHVWKWILFGIFAKDRYDSVGQYFSVKNLEKSVFSSWLNTDGSQSFLCEPWSGIKLWCKSLLERTKFEKHHVNLEPWTLTLEPWPLAESGSAILRILFPPICFISNLGICLELGLLNS